jgi:hypothetical protein
MFESSDGHGVATSNAYAQGKFDRYSNVGAEELKNCVGDGFRASVPSTPGGTTGSAPTPNGVTRGTIPSFAGHVKA